MPWSYSALTAFETCPRKYYHLSVARDVREKPSQSADYGQYVHKKFELRLIKGEPLPLDLRHHEPVMARLADAPGEGMPEQKVALDERFKPTGFFDKDVWVRGVIDFTKVNGRHALVVDHKTGRMKSDTEQVELMVAIMMCLLPELETARGAYYWTKEKQLTTTPVLSRDDLPAIWNQFLPRVERMQEAIAREEFPARPNGLCRRYCPVKQCPHNGE